MKKHYILPELLFGIILIAGLVCLVISGMIFDVLYKSFFPLWTYRDQMKNVGVFTFLKCENEVKASTVSIDTDIEKYKLSYTFSENKLEDVIVCDKEQGTSVITGPTFTYDELSNLEFLKSHFYTITSVTSLNEQVFDVKKALDADLSIKQDNSVPQILIFHSHSQENFVDSVDGDDSTYIVGVGERLTEILRNKYGYNVIHDKTKFDILDGNLDRGKAYTYANESVDKYLREYPSIEVILDIHRDGVDDNLKFVTDIDGKPTAMVMFFNGISYTNVNGPISYLYNPYVQDNLAMSLQMQLLASAYYPEFARRIYIQGYRYSQHHAPKSMLIEVGAQTNTIEEELNAMEPLADILDKLLSGSKVY